MQSRHPGGPPLPGHPDASHLDELPVPAVAVDLTGTVTYANAAASALFGRPIPDLLGQRIVSSLFAEAEGGAAQEVLNQVLTGSQWTGDLAAVTATGKEFTAQISCTPLIADNTVLGALFIAQRTGRRGAVRRETTRVADRLTRLARVAAELVLADDIAAVTKVVINHAADAAGATVASLSLLVDDDTLALQGLRGGPKGASSRWATYSVHANTPAGDAVRTGRQILLTGHEQIQARYPGLETSATGERTMICLPLKVAGHAMGAVSLSFPGIRDLDFAEMEFLGILADICAQALDRMQAITAAAVHARRLEFLAHASTELSSSLDYQATLRKVTRLAVPTFADWCAIDLVEDGDLHTLSVAHQDPQKVALAEELQRSYPPDRDSPQGTYNVMRTGVSELIPEITDEMLVAGTVDAEHLRLARELNLHSALIVPLVARDSVLGVISWVSGESMRTFTQSDMVFAEDLARRAAIAIDNAQLHSETLQAAVRLQRAVLPDTLPTMPGWDLATHYSPAGRTEVGGDFYDVIPLDDGRLAIFVGDVMGRGVVAAAAMAQMRAAVRAYLAIDSDPVLVIEKLDRMFDRYAFTQLVTLIYLLVDPGNDQLVSANAGHPPPVVLRSDGTVEQLSSPGEGPLGLPGASRSAQTFSFHEGDTLLVFTDGLIERRSEDIDAGQLRVVDACAMLASPDLFGALNGLVESVRDHTRQDDVAAVAARRTRTTS